MSFNVSTPIDLCLGSVKYSRYDCQSMIMNGDLKEEKAAMWLDDDQNLIFF